MEHQRISVADLIGTWRRSLLQDCLGRQDRTTEVTWLQGPCLFGDLRQPLPARAVRAGCLSDLTADDAALLARQEGFGGGLVRHTDHFEWVRAIDYQPKTARGDRGHLTWQGDVLVEAGYDLAYIEHWHRCPRPGIDASALRLVQSVIGVAGLLVRADDRFAFVRDRAIPLAEGRHLSDLVREAPSLEAMQDLVDCEISMGFVYGWRIERSTLPWRVGASLAPDRSAEHLVTADVGRFGQAEPRSWTILDEEAT